MPVVGSRAQVWNGTAQHTSGGLTKADLHYNSKTGRIVSLKKHNAGVKSVRDGSNPLGTHLIPKGHHEFVPGGMGGTGRRRRHTAAPAAAMLF